MKAQFGRKKTRPSYLCRHERYVFTTRFIGLTRMNIGIYSIYMCGWSIFFCCCFYRSLVSFMDILYMLSNKTTGLSCFCFNSIDCTIYSVGCGRMFSRSIHSVYKCDLPTVCMHSLHTEINLLQIEKLKKNSSYCVIHMHKIKCFDNYRFSTYCR